MECCAIPQILLPLQTKIPLKSSVEIKSTEEVRSANIRNIRIFADEFPGSRRILVSLDRFSRNIGEVECLYVYDFFHMLWSEGL